VTQVVVLSAVFRRFIVHLHSHASQQNHGTIKWHCDLLYTTPVDELRYVARGKLDDYSEQLQRWLENKGKTGSDSVGGGGGDGNRGDPITVVKKRGTGGSELDNWDDGSAALAALLDGGGDDGGASDEGSMAVMARPAPLVCARCYELYVARHGIWCTVTTPPRVTAASHH
jgi:hypothetical protein